MQTAVIVFLLIIAVLFIGGGVNVGSRPVFGHIDAVLGTTVLMDLHHMVFSLLYRGEESPEGGMRRTRSDMDKFQEAPAGFDKKKHYKQLDKASDY